MAASAQVAVPANSTATLLFAGSSDSVAGNTVLLFNAGAGTVGIGGSDVSSSNMFRALVAGATLVLDLAEGEALYGFVPTGSAAGAVDVLRVK